MNVLENTKCYLIGAIEEASDSGLGWRTLIQTRLESMGVVVFNPCDKPFEKDFSETLEMQQLIKGLRAEKRYDELAEVIKNIRIYDLNLVDRADFIFFYYDPKVSTCGSWEEFFWANRLKKPIFFVCDEEERIPLWLYGTLPYKYFYNSLADAMRTLVRIDEGYKEIDSDRWRLLRKEYR